MYLPDFDYYAPATLKEACSTLARLDGGASVLAGGTDLLPYMKNEVMAPMALVSLKEIQGLQGITYIPVRGVVIGAKATQNGLVRSPVLRDKYLSVCETAHSMANYQIRNRGTIGGNLVSAVPSADLPPILIALRANIALEGPYETRTIPLEEFFVGPRRSVIHSDEILTEIVIPDQDTTGSAYLKFGLRRSGALAVVGVAVSLIADGMRIEEARIVLGAVAPTPVRALEAERLLRGNKVTEALLEEVGRTAASECRPISDIRGSEEYRREMVGVFTKRALRKALNLTISDDTEETR
jgi:aerobic carbon-monoxide dehydrogenase medium subunit